MKGKKLVRKLSALLSMALLLSACGRPEDSSVKNAASSVSSIEQQYPAVIENDGDAVDGAVLKVGVVSDSGFKGIFNGFFSSDGIDEAFTKYTMDGAFPVDGDFKIIMDSDETPIKVSADTDSKTITYRINPKFKWSNGETVSTEDIIRTYEIAASQEYILAAQSVRYNSEMEVIEGMEEYNKGKADSIRGLEAVDDSTLVIHLKSMNPGVLWGGPFVTEFINAKQYEGIPMDKITESDALRKNPLSYGPYVIKDVIQGEKVVFEANPYYYRGEPKVKKAEIEILPTSQQVAAVKAGKYDIVFQAGTDIFPQLAELDNIKIASRQDLFLSFMGFRQGKWDSENNRVVTDPDAKLNNIHLKKAMAYAIDNDAIGEKFYHGLRFTAPSPINPAFKSLHNPEMTGYRYDIDKANKLLDEGGYKDIDNDGFREDRDGKPLEIKLGMVSGGEIAEPLSQYYIQQWKEIGLNVALTDGRLTEFHDFYDRLESDDPSIEVFMAGIGLSSDPNPSGLCGDSSPFNVGRYTSERLQNSLDRLNSQEAMDSEQMSMLYHEFEEIFFEEAPVIPLQNRVDILPVNNRVKMYDWNYDKTNGFDWSKIELTADSPIVSRT